MKKKGIAVKKLSLAALIVTAFVFGGAAFAGEASLTGPGSPPGADVQGLLALVKDFNPTLAAAALDAQEAAAKIYPAGALDDPMATFFHEQGFRQTMISVSQEFPLWGKRDIRRSVATANARAASDRRGSVQQELEEQIKVAFAQYYAANRSLRVTLDISTVLETLADTVRARYAQGLAIQSDAVRADLERSRIDTELFALERNEEAAKARINALIGRQAEAPLAEPALLREVPQSSSLTLTSLMVRVLEQNPMLAMRLAEIAAAEGELRLVEKSWYPGVTLSVGTSDLPGKSPRPSVGVGVRVPLQWGVIRANEQAASAKASAARFRLTGTALQIESDLKSAIETLEQAQRSEALLEDALSQQSEAAYQSALISYQNTQGDLTAVLDAIRQQFLIRLEVLRAQAEEQAALAAIERQIGGEL